MTLIDLDEMFMRVETQGKIHMQKDLSMLKSIREL